MKNILIVFLFLSSVSYAQDTTFYDLDWNKTMQVYNAKYYKVVKNDTVKKDIRIIESIYTTAGKLKSQKSYLNYTRRLLDGNSKEWYDSGQLKKDVNYKKGLLHGSVLTYWENGNAKRIDKFANGRATEKACYGKAGEKLEYFEYSIAPEYPTGEDGLISHIARTTKYPRNSRENNIQGEIIIGYNINEDGSISNFEIIKGLNDELNNESIRVISTLSKYKPAMEDGEFIKKFVTTNVNFKLM